MDKPKYTSNHRNYIQQIEEHNDTMYVGTSNGLYLVDQKTGTKLIGYLNNGELPERYRESTKSVKSIYPEIEKGYIWAALMDGLYKISKKDGSHSRYTIPEQWSDSLSHNFFKTPLVGDQIHFPSWGLGMVEFDFETNRFKRHTISETYPNRHEYNTVRSAIPLNDSLALVSGSKVGNGFFNTRTNSFKWQPTPNEMKQTWATELFMDANGFVWSAQTGKIFRSTKPILHRDNAYSSVLDISAVFVNNRLEKIPALSGYEPMELNEYQRNVQLEFTVTKPHVYESITYEYKIGNESWQPVPTKNVLDLNLGVGTNRIQLQAKSANGDVIAKTEFELLVLVPFYKTLWFLILVGLFLIALTYFTVNYLNKKSHVGKLEELDKAKSRFFNNISHEFRTPLTIMATPIQNRLNEPNLDAADRREFELMLKSNKRLTNLVDQLLELSKLESGKGRLQVSKLQPKPFLNMLAEPFQYQAENKGIDFRFCSELAEDEIWCDGEAVQKILNNLLANAVKYTPESGTIQFRASLKKGLLELRIENTGNPLSKEEKNKLFNRYYQTNPNSSGVGIGLALVKELVELHRGKIAIDTSFKHGTAFVLELPVVRARFNDAEIVSDITIDIKQIETIDESIVEPLELTEEPTKPLLLLVEDNTGLRLVLKRTLAGHFQISIAKNGLEGSKKAIEEIPDLIISDVMMPEKTGVEMANELKQNELTSHIPIILLTAKAGDENELIGIQSGADDYITKPFNAKLLKTKIQNLLNIREDMRSRYSQEVFLKPLDIAITPADEIVLERIQTVLDTHLTESSFSTEIFAQELGFSRMQLHRKLKALTGLSATEFIRSQRLKLAVELLEKSDATVSEVCYQTGFNNLSYFAKCFKEAYGVSPSQYSKKAE